MQFAVLHGLHFTVNVNNTSYNSICLRNRPGSVFHLYFNSPYVYTPEKVA